VKKGKAKTWEPSRGGGKEKKNNLLSQKKNCNMGTRTESAKRLEKKRERTQGRAQEEVLGRPPA